MFKDGNLKTLQEDIFLEKRITPKQVTTVARAVKNKSIMLDYHWLTDMAYRKHKLNYVECKETTLHLKTKESITQRFVHITDFETNGENSYKVSDIGRLRQKIENEGFNTQKKQGYALEHKYSRVSFLAMKNYYQSLQIAHIINQFVEAGQTFKTLQHKTLKCSVKYLWKRLLSFLLENHINTNELLALTAKPFQIRLE